MAETEGLVTEVYFERVFNLGNYETMRMGLKATVGPDSTPAEILKYLDKYTMKVRKETGGGR
jgi:proteasome assembly chaperone (PAC2) family protein